MRANGKMPRRKQVMRKGKAMTRFMCRFCGRIFEQEDVSVPMKDNVGFTGWIWMRDNCPVCKKGMDDWYVSERWWKYMWREAVRYQRNVRQ